MKSNWAQMLAWAVTATLVTQIAAAAPLATNSTDHHEQMVTAVPNGIDVPCDTELMPFRFAPKKKGFDGSNAYWMMWMSMRAFAAEAPQTRADFERLGFRDYTVLDNPTTGLHGFVTASDDAVIVSFRGSYQPIDWLVDASIALVNGTPMQLPGRVHEGFALDIDASWMQIQTVVDQYSKGIKPIWVTGHSLGGALATITAYRLAALGYPVAPLYTFAAPRSGDTEYAAAGYQLLNGQHYRFTNDTDLVPHVPGRAKSAELFSVLFPGTLGNWLSNLFAKDLDYANYSEWIRFDAQGLDTKMKLDEVADDEAFWTALGSLVSVDGATQAAEAIFGRQALLHSHKAYYCLMQNYYQRLPAHAS